MLKFIAGVVVGVAVTTTSVNPETRLWYTKSVRFAADFLTTYADELATDLQAKKEKNYR